SFRMFCVLLFIQFVVSRAANHSLNIEENYQLYGVTEAVSNPLHETAEGNPHFLQDITKITEPNSTSEDNRHLSSNNTTFLHVEPKWRIILDKTASLMMMVITVSAMLAMGAATSWREVWNHSKNPSRAIIGMVGQFVMLPALSVCMSLAFSLTPTEAIGVLVVSCSPGGSASNFFTYWLDGDLALSIVMTTWSSALSVGTMPLNIWIYSRIWIVR
ncbi:unnamed protein product, partial [Meganyctiphanes norvegica]